jgi:hypothetical protein
VDFGLKLNWKAPMDGLVYSILFSEWNADKTRVRSSLTAVARLVCGIDLCVGVYGGG